MLIITIQLQQTIVCYLILNTYMQFKESFILKERERERDKENEIKVREKKKNLNLLKIS